MQGSIDPFAVVISNINERVKRWLKSASAWHAIHPSLIDTERQYRERISMANSCFAEIKLLYALLPEGDTTSFGLTYSLSDVSNILTEHLTRAGSLLSDSQRRSYSKR